MIQVSSQEVKNWVLVLIWMSVIFMGSTDIGSSHHSSRILGPIIRWFKPNIGEEALSRVLYTIRKTGHVSEYAVLAMLTFRALAARNSKRKPLIVFAGAFAICVLYAGSDEFHQSFVPSRDSSIRDVGFDSAGSVAGLALFAFWRRRRGLNL